MKKQMEAKSFVEINPLLVMKITDSGLEEGRDQEYRSGNGPLEDDSLMTLTRDLE